ncbi:unnamed protein product, partial [Vitis vinifera]
MGEVVVSSEAGGGGMEGEVEKKEVGSGVVRWERFLPRMVLRVLLVEADDSTRQIIAALLRKCSYKVAAVPDGLKAWEVLKARPHNIDLILTEVELPSISGFALLTLVMEHEICKNIPVIMMSSHGSINTVYKCMLRGAADFLVKPVRRNELKNLWQHVWRRQSSTVSGNGPQDESVAQQKVEATSENNPTSNHSSDHVACIQKNKEALNKVSDAQSSCSKPDLEAESAYMETMQDFSNPTWSRSLVSDTKMQKNEECAKLGPKFLMHNKEAGGTLEAACRDVNTMTQPEAVEPENDGQGANAPSEACGNNAILGSSSREAIDLIGVFDNSKKCTYGNSSSNNGTKKSDSIPQLDLSLRRSHPSSPENQVADERHTLNHSNGSAFSRYINRSLQPPHLPSTGVFNQQKNFGADSDKRLSQLVTGYNSDITSPTLSTQRSVISLATSPSGRVEIALCGPQQRAFPAPVPQNANNSTSQTNHKPEHKLDSLEGQGHFSPATDQNSSSSFGNGGASNLNSFGCGSICGSNGNANTVAVVQAAAEGKNEEGIFSHEGHSQRSIQREAALTKFRLKRKDRCFEKKVRYESRKKLAEQRPRVKGQFVRQVHTIPPPAEPDTYYGSSFDVQPQRSRYLSAQPLRASSSQLLYPTHTPLQESKYEGHEESNLLTASLVGTALPVAPSFGYEVGRDQTAGKLVLSLKLDGRVRWKVGTWVSGRYRLNVNCVAVMAFGPSIPSGPLSSKEGTQCSTTV